MIQRVSIAFINYVIFLFIITIKHQEYFGRKHESTVNVLQKKNTTLSYFNETVYLCLFIKTAIIADIIYNLILGLYNAIESRTFKTSLSWGGGRLLILRCFGIGKSEESSFSIGSPKRKNRL